MALFDVKGNKVSTCCDIEGNTFGFLCDITGESVMNSDLTVMSFNVQRWTGINANADIISEIFEKYNPDLVGFQEYDTSKTLDDVAVNLYMSRRWNVLREGATTITNYTKAVVSNLSLSDATTVYYSTYAESRSYQKMYITLKDKRIAVFNTHLDYLTPYKYEQAVELFNAVSQEEYFILIGDLNTVCTATTDADYVQIMKQFVDAGFNCANCSEAFGFINTWFGGTTLGNSACEQTDNIITSSNISIDRVVVDTTKVDANTGMTIDHLPLVAYLTVH